MGDLLEYDDFAYEDFDAKIDEHKINILPDLPIEFQINSECIYDTFLNLYTYYKTDDIYNSLPYEFYSDFVLSETERFLNTTIDDQKFYSELKKKIFI